MNKKHRGIELDVKLDESGNPVAARVTASGYPDIWFAVPVGTSADQARAFTKKMEIACWRAGYEALRRAK